MSEVQNNNKGESRLIYESYNTSEKAETYSALSVQDPWWEHVDDYTFKNTLGDLEGKSVLDLGCGEGRVCRNLQKWGAANVMGMDIIPAMIDMAKEKGPSDIVYTVGNPEDTKQLCDELFDIVVSTYVLQYAHDYTQLQKLVECAYNNLKDGGRFCGVASCYDPSMGFEGINTVMKGSFKRNSVEEFSPVFCRLGDFTMTIYSIYPSTLEKVIKEVGFKTIKRHPMLLSKKGEKHFTQKQVQHELRYVYQFEAFK